MTGLDIESVAIIGAGPGGIASLYEFLHTNKAGTSSIRNGISKDPKFKKIVAFEQKDAAGGIWANSNLSNDLPFPPQELLDAETYADPSVLQPKKILPSGLENSTLEQPLSAKISKESAQLEWKQSGLYPDLFTNIPLRFTRFSYMSNNGEYLDKSRRIYPFMTGKELCNQFEEFIRDNNLEQYIRLNSRVEKLSKTNEGKWLLTVKEVRENQENWYQESFDAVVVAVGHYTIPNIPRIKGLAEFGREYPGSLIHAKSYKDRGIFKNKKVLVIGGSISTANLVQYIYPLSKSTIISKRNPHLVFKWINAALESEGLVSKPPVRELRTSNKTVVFEDGSEEPGVDIILFATGYHYHFPFLESHLKISNPSNVSRVNGLYHHTFSIEDPTLAVVGVPISSINFHSIEASAAAVAGVWSNATVLPSKEEQYLWEKNRVVQMGDNYKFHFYPHNSLKEDFVDVLLELAPKGRYNPLEIDGDFVHEIDDSMPYLESLFYALKEGKIQVEDTLAQ